MRHSRAAFATLGLLRAAAAALFDVSLSSVFDRAALIEYIHAERERRNGDFSVIDIGATGNPWSVQAGLVDAIADLFAHHFQSCWDGVHDLVAEACCRWPPPKPPWPYHNCFDKVQTRERCCRSNRPRPKVLLFSFDITSPDSWEPVYEYVRAFGRFDFAICSHVLEDIIDPRVVVKALPLVAEAGWVAIPSKFSELERGREHVASGVAGQYRGCIHHRWIYTVRNGTLLAVPKMPVLDADVVHDGVQRIGDTSIEQLSFWWRRDIPFELLNGGYLGPSIDRVVEMLREAIALSAGDEEATMPSTAPHIPA